MIDLILCSLLLPNLGIIVLMGMTSYFYRTTSFTGLKYSQLSVPCFGPRMPKQFNRNKSCFVVFFYIA